MKNQKLIELINKEIRRRKSFLQEYVGLDYNAFTADFRKQELALRHIQVAISACLDIARLIPKKDHFMFEDLADKLEKAKEIRKHIIYYYLDDDLTDVHKFIQDDLDYFDRYYEAVNEYLR